jgi:hypothetical protein
MGFLSAVIIPCIPNWWDIFTKLNNYQLLESNLLHKSYLRKHILIIAYYANQMTLKRCYDANL